MSLIDHLRARASTIRAVALDVDGTLARADHLVSDRAVEAVRRLPEAGIMPILVTGRTERSTQALSRRASITLPFVSCGGGVVTDPVSGERLFIAELDGDAVRRGIEFARSRRLEPVIWTLDAIVVPHPSPSADLLATVNSEPVRVQPTLPTDGVVKMMFASESATLDALAADVHSAVPWMLRSMPQFYESASGHATKRNGLLLVLDRLGVRASDCLGVGDGDTDAEWLAEIGVPIVPSNARPAARAAALAEIGHHDDDTVAQLLEVLLELR